MRMLGATDIGSGTVLSALCDAETDLNKKRDIARQIMDLTARLKNF